MASHVREMKPVLHQWLARSAAAWPVGMSAMAMIFLIAFFASAAQVLVAGSTSPIVFVLAAADPAYAAIALLSLVVLCPSVFTVGTLKFPLNWTLPTLFIAFVLAVKWTRTEDPVATRIAEDVVRIDAIWLDARFLTAVWVAQVIVLTLVGRAEGQRQAPPDSKSC